MFKLIKHTNWDRIKPQRRRGSLVTELWVSATLLGSIVAIVAPVAVRTSRIWQDTRHCELALDELTNQLERLVLLEDSERDSELQNLEISAPVAKVLVDGMLTGEMLDDEAGKRIELSISWDRAYPSKPLKLVGWVEPLENQSATEDSQ